LPGTRCTQGAWTLAIFPSPLLRHWYSPNVLPIIHFIGFYSIIRQQAKMNMMLVPMLLPLLLLLQVSVPVTSRLLSAHVTSYRKSRTTVNGPVRCALDSANKTSSSSSLQDCSLDCARDGTCIGFNIKNSLTCDVYNYNPKMTGLVSDCAFYQVNNSLNCLFTC